MITKIKNYILLLFVLTLVGCAGGVGMRYNLILAKKPSNNIALLLPLSGPFAQSGKAIRNGFLTAYYHSVSNNKLSTHLQILDTYQADVVRLYKQAVANGAKFIVGPLTKANVRKLANLKTLSVPTLALNTLANYKTHRAKNLLQFGLFTQDEVMQVTTKAWREHSGRALIIVPTGAWGDNLLQFIQKTWISFGGSIATVIKYGSAKSLDEQIKSALSITNSTNNAQDLRYTLREKFKFVPRRRKDIDVIILIATPSKARQIKPLLAFYFAGNIPTYATSNIYSGRVQPELDRDLNGIIFCDMPWVLNQDKDLPPLLPGLRNKIKGIWPRDFARHSKLYALGIDAYYVMLNVSALVHYARQGITGATGLLFLDKYGHIFRRLNWAVMRNGKPYLLVKV
jgi:uncharacterized protein